MTGTEPEHHIDLPEATPKEQPRTDAARWESEAPLRLAAEAASLGTWTHVPCFGQFSLSAEPFLAASHATGTTELPRVLIVEDNRDSADSLQALLELVGYPVAVAYSGTEAVTTAAAFCPDVVLCDLGLPGMNGFEVAAELRRNPLTSGAHLIALSGYAREEDQQRARAVGFDRHLRKPVGFEELQPLLEAIHRTEERGSAGRNPSNDGAPNRTEDG